MMLGSYLFRNTSISRGFSLLLAFSVILAGSIGLLSFQSSFGKYNNIIYSLEVESLGFYTENVENELVSLEKHSFSVVTNNSFQQYLNAANQKDSILRHKVHPMLTSLLASIGFKESYTETVLVVDTFGTQYLQGRSYTYDKAALDYIISETAKAEGRSVILPPGPYDSCIIFARQIRQIEQITLEPSGYFIMRINPNKLIDYTSRYAGRYSGNLSIFSGSQPIFETGAARGEDFIGEILEREKSGSSNGFFIKKTPEGRKFVVYSNSPYTGWIYVNVLSYDEVFRELEHIRSVNLLLVLVTLCAVIAIGLAVSHSISRPIVALSRVMSHVENGNFNIDPEELNYKWSFYEVRKLCSNYMIMLNRIDALINEDYKKQILLKDAQLRRLEAQINPHFLYNTLESINGMARIGGNENISLMVQALGRLMRSAISRDTAPGIPLSSEIALLEDYLSIQKIRYGSRLEVSIITDKASRHATIPKLTLEPIVENSIIYTLEKNVGVCKIELTAVERGEELVLSITDNGPGIKPEIIEGIMAGTVKAHGTGMGIRNIIERIKIIYGEKGRLEIISGEGKGTQVLITIPFVEEDYDV